MGFLNEIKKALFGAKSVAKSAGRKVAEEARETGEEFVERSGEYLDKARNKAGELLDDARDFVEDPWKGTEDPVEEISRREKEKPDNTLSDDPLDDLLQEQEERAFGSDVSPTAEEENTEVPFEPKPEPKERKPGELEKLGGKVLDASDKVVDRVFDKAEEVGDELLDTGEKFMGKVKDTSGKLGKKLMDETEESRGRVQEEAGRLFDKAKAFGEDLFQKAQEEAGREGDLDELTEEARRQEAELERRIRERGSRSNAENLERDRKEDPLSGTDSFFERARRFADGDYHDKGKDEGDMKISKDPDYQPKAKSGMVPGFEDLDGDGDEIIDDAILDEDDKE